MPLADEFQEIVDALPSDWTDMELDLRVEEDRYIDAATTIAQFGHAAAPPAVHGTLRLLDEMGIRGELKLRDYRTGRVETTQMWGRPESVRQEFRRLRQQ